MIDLGVGEVPDEFIDSELCEIYHISWRELQKTPYYVRVYWWHVQQMKAVKAAQDAEDAQAAQDGRQVIRHA